MKPLTREWVSKAEGDFATASREMRVRRAFNPEAVCFHAQQCAEKYLKALLQESVIPFQRTHDLVALAELLGRGDSSWDDLRSQLQKLRTFGVAIRYPGGKADRRTAREALAIAQLVRFRVRSRFRRRLGPSARGKREAGSR
jgi:HEPN domain-containing protein